MVKEDVTEIVLNIKGLIAKLHCDGPKTVEIAAEGPCVVTADSIKCDSEVEILNPDLHIATLGEGAKLYMEIVLDKGRGYVSGERNKQSMPQGVIGELAVDSIYTPVLKVNFNVEPTRVGQSIDYDKLTPRGMDETELSPHRRRFPSPRRSSPTTSRSSWTCPIRARARRSWWRRTTRARKRFWK